MKKILSLVMVVAMLLAVLAFVGCDDTNTDNSSSSSSSSNTTASSNNENADNNTTSGSTTESTTESTTQSTTESTTESTTVFPVFARFDFGTSTKAEALGYTSHEYLVEYLTFDSEFISATFTEDSLVITALKDHPEIKSTVNEKGNTVEDFNGYSSISYAIRFDSYGIYDFDQHLTKNDKFMKIRILNNTNNNIISFAFGDIARSSSSYATTLNASCLYLQGGAPSVRDIIAGDNKLTADPVNEYKSYTYDINLVMALTRYAQRGEAAADYSYADYTCRVGQGITGTGSNNWNWIAADSEVHSLRFWLLGAYGVHFNTDYFAYADNRENIKAGNTVEVDYIVFAPTTGDFKNFTSNIEDAYISESNSIKESESIAASISASISESEAALTATTAAAA